MPIYTLDTEMAHALRDKAYKERKHRFANYLRSVVHRLCTWGMLRGWTKTNPYADIEPIKRPRDLPSLNRRWQPHEFEAVFEQAKQPGIKLALALGLYGGRRLSDVLAFKWSDCDGQALEWTASKNNQLVWTPAHPFLKQLLDEADRDSKLVVTNLWQKPYTQDGFRIGFYQIIEMLEKSGNVKPGLTFHGLRHTHASQVTEYGGSERDVMTVSGDKSAAMAKLYTEGANRKQSAQSNIKRLTRTNLDEKLEE